VIAEITDTNRARCFTCLEGLIVVARDRELTINVCDLWRETRLTTERVIVGLDWAVTEDDHRRHHREINQSLRFVKATVTSDLLNLSLTRSASCLVLWITEGF